MPLNGFRSVTVPPEAYATARKLVSSGVDESIGQVFAKAVKEYANQKADMIREIEAVKAKYEKR